MPGGASVGGLVHARSAVPVAVAGTDQDIVGIAGLNQERANRGRPRQVIAHGTNTAAKNKSTAFHKPPPVAPSQSTVELWELS